MNTLTFTMHSPSSQFCQLSSWTTYALWLSPTVERGFSDLAESCCSWQIETYIFRRQFTALSFGKASKVDSPAGIMTSPHNHRFLTSSVELAIYYVPWSRPQMHSGYFQKIHATTALNQKLTPFQLCDLKAKNSNTGKIEQTKIGTNIAA